MHFLPTRFSSRDRHHVMQVHSGQLETVSWKYIADDCENFRSVRLKPLRDNAKPLTDLNRMTFSYHRRMMKA